MKKLIIILLFACQVVWGQTKISDGVLKSSVVGDEKIPVSGSGHPVINTNRIYTYMKARMDSLYTGGGGWPNSTDFRLASTNNLLLNSTIPSITGTGISTGENVLINTGPSTLTTGFRNTFTGLETGKSMTVGTENTFYGRLSGDAITGASDNNAFFGYGTGHSMTLGSSNTFLGDHAGLTMTSTNKTVLIGYNARPGYESGVDGMMSIQNVLFGLSNTGYYTTVSTGNFGLYQPIPSHRFHFSDPVTSHDMIRADEGQYTFGSYNTGDQNLDVQTANSTYTSRIGFLFSASTFLGGMKSTGAGSGAIQIGGFNSGYYPTFYSDGTAQVTISTTGNIQLLNAGQGLQIKGGSNATIGTATANGSTEVTVSTTKVTNNSIIIIMCQSGCGATSGPYYISARTASTSFGFKSTVGDTGTVGWWILEKN